MRRKIRKPLIVMTPKSLLRHKRAVSRLEELAKGTTFHRILYDDAQMLPDEPVKLVGDDKIRRIILCSGKVYYDLYEEREKRGIDDIYLLRIEQLYPFPSKALVAELARFKQAEMLWVQEEPRNMGAWFFVDVFLQWVLNQIGAKHRTMRYAGRPASASTAVGLNRCRPRWKRGSPGSRVGSSAPMAVWSPSSICWASRGAETYGTSWLAWTTRWEEGRWRRDPTVGGRGRIHTC